MKKIVVIILVSLTIFSCKTMQENIQARKNLEKCKYEFKELLVKSVSIRKGKLKDVVFDTTFKITNNADSDVAMDRMTGKIYLDKRRTATLAHRQFLRIKPGKSKNAPIEVTVPFSKTIKAIGRFPKEITLEVTVYMSLMIGEVNLVTNIPITVRQTFPVPYDKIQRMVGKAIKKSLKKKPNKKSIRKAFKNFR